LKITSESGDSSKKTPEVGREVDKRAEKNFYNATRSKRCLREAIADSVKLNVLGKKL